MQLETVPNSFAFTSPYRGFRLEHFYRIGGIDLFGGKTKTENHFRSSVCKVGKKPELVIFGNFIVERHALQSLCRQWEIDTICGEDGSFPHYETLHADPLGFSWESSLCRMVFRNLTDRQRTIAQAKRIEWVQFRRQELPAGVRPPYVLWPLQLIGDKVNRWDLNVSDWAEMIVHFRQSLPKEYQLVIKPHPRANRNDEPNSMIADLPNVQVLRERCDLRSLIEQSSATAGANSTVLMEARLMFHKPAYVYARGWFTNHSCLFTPVSLRYPARELNHFDQVAKNSCLHTEYLQDYTDWFLYQLLVRQMDHHSAKNWAALRQWIFRRTYRSFLSHGEEIFQ